jgi:hypothetical protein
VKTKVGLFAITALFSVLGLLAGNAWADMSTWTLSIDPTVTLQPDGSALTTVYFSCDPGTPVELDVTVQSIGSGATNATCDGTVQTSNVSVTPDFPGGPANHGCTTAWSEVTEATNTQNMMGTTTAFASICSAKGQG